MTGTRLSEQAVLVSLHIGAKDSTSKRGGVFHPDILRDVNKAVSRARDAHRTLTLPWDDDARIISVHGYSSYMDTMWGQRKGVELILNRLIKVYRDEAPRGKESYTVKELRDKYHFDLETRQVPDINNFKAQLPPSNAAVIVDMKRRADERIKIALNDAFERVVKLTDHMAKSLRAYKPAEGAGRVENKFHDSLAYNIRDLAEMLPAFNIVGDPRMDELAAQLVAELVEPNSPDILRVNKRERLATADRADAIVKKVRGYMIV